MSTGLKEKVIILKTSVYSESDLIVQALSSKGSRLSFIARGAKRSKKRFAGGLLEPTHCLNVVYSESRGKDLLSLEEAQLVEGFENLRKDYDKLQIAFYFLDSVLKVSQQGDSISEQLFFLLGHSLRSLNEVKNFKYLLVHFIIKFMNQQGVLEHAAWMEDFIQKPLAHHHDEFANHLEAHLPKKLELSFAEHEKWLKKNLESYLKTAQI